LARANLQDSLDPAALDHVKRAARRLEDAEALLDESIPSELATSTTELRAETLIGMSGQLPKEREKERLEALSSAEKMLSSFLAILKQQGQAVATRCCA